MQQNRVALITCVCAPEPQISILGGLMDYKIKYDDLTEQFDIDLDGTTWLSVSGMNRGKWANEICELLNKQPPNKEVANVCAECGSDLKWWVTCYRCRNLDCRAEYPHNAEL